MKKEFVVPVVVALVFSFAITGHACTNSKRITGNNGRNSSSGSATIRVGPGRPYSKPSEAAKVAKDGDVIEILAGTYPGDAAVWIQNNLTIRGVHGRAHLPANGQLAQGKAIWVIKGKNTTIENIEFSGAKVPDRNGAGIRQEGPGLTIGGCYFHDNENGILAGADTASDIVVEHTEFSNNGFGDGQTHNIYIGRVRSFTLRYSYSHHARVGHNVKSRAQTNYILYNRIMDEETGASSYAVEFPNGGTSYVIGNLIQQGPKSENFHIIMYGAERLNSGRNDLYIVNNTIVNDRDSGVFVKVRPGASPAMLVNNIFCGPGKVLIGPGEMQANLVVSEDANFDFESHGPGFVNAAEFDYRLKSTSPAIDRGVDPGRANGFDLKPSSHYLHAARSQKRIQIGAIDIGAYEYSAPGH